MLISFHCSFREWDYLISKCVKVIVEITTSSVLVFHFV